MKEVKPVAAIDHSAAQHVGNAISAMLARSAEKKSADAKFASLGKENARAAAMRELVFEPAAAYKVSPCASRWSADDHACHDPLGQRPPNSTPF